MGRRRTDSPLLFPWDKIFSEDALNEAFEYCKSDSCSADILKKAVTTLVTGYNSGSKSVLCDRLKEKAGEIIYQINKVEEPRKREKLRKETIDYYRTLFLKKFEGKDPEIVNIQVAPRPSLPVLSTDEKKMFNDVRSRSPSPERKKPVVVIEEEEEIIPVKPLKPVVPLPPTVDVTDELLLSSKAIVYYANLPREGQKIPVKFRVFYDQLMNEYKDIVPSDSPLLDENKIKEEIRKTVELAKIKKGVLEKSVIDKANTVVNKSKTMSRYIPKKVQPVIIEEDEEEEEIIITKKQLYKDIDKILSSSVNRNLSNKQILDKLEKIYGDLSLRKKEIYGLIKEWAEENMKDEEEQKEEPVISKEEPKEEGLSPEEILKYIQKKGWKEPQSKSKEGLCDYVLKNITQEDTSYEQRYTSLENEMKELKSKYDKVAKKLKARKITFGPDQIRVFEQEKEELEEQIKDVIQEMEAIEEKKEKEEPEKAQMCFRMKEWLNQDDFDKVEVVKDLNCGEGYCNVDSGVCSSSSPDITDSYTEIGSSKIKGSKQMVDTISSKFNSPTSSDLRQQIEIIIKNSPLKSDIRTKDVMSELSMLYNGLSFKNRKEEIKGIVKDLKKKLIKPVIIEEDEEEEIQLKEDIEEAIEQIQEITEEQIREATLIAIKSAKKGDKPSDIRKRVAEEFNIMITPYEDFINNVIKEYSAAKKEAKKVKKALVECYTKDDLSDIKCPDDLVCNLTTKVCIEEKDAVEPVEELTIGGMLVKVTGENNIIKALREKILKSGGEIPTEEPVKEPVEEPVKEPIVQKEEVIIESVVKPLEEVIEQEEPANDVFTSLIPGKRPSLEDIVSGIKSITKSVGVTSAQSRIKVAERKCLERIAACAGIKM